MIDVESDFVLVPRATTFVMSRTLTYRRPGNLLYRLFAALVGEYEVEETTVFVTESPVGDLSLCSSVFLDEVIKDEEVEAELATLLAS